LRYDNALQIPNSNGIGKKVTRTSGASVTG